MDLARLSEFNQVVNRISEICRTSGAAELAQSMEFKTDFEQISVLLRQTVQMKNILSGVKPFPDSGFIDMRKVLLQLKTAGSYIALENMPQLSDSLTCIKDVLTFLNSCEPKDIPDLLNVVNGLEFEENILRQCNNIIDSEGNIRPSCSPVLENIYNQTLSKRRQIENSINRIILRSKKEGWTNDEDSISVRNGTFVVPVKASYKRNMRGILHGTSQTGQTFYIEPDEIVSLNFEIKELYFEEQKEIRRILSEFSDLLREHMQSLLEAYRMIVRIDFIRAKALYALQTESAMPQLTDKPLMEWYDARHPVLEQVLKRKSNPIVPLSIKLNQKQRILVISGPNAGGKSVCLKTAALLQYMLQCGLLVPMKSVSTAGIFQKIYLSIGDEQSLTDDLSTYSSHLKNMTEICRNANKDTLFLIDELGTGTEPEAGGAIAQSILEHLNARKSFGIVTTHYSVLKHTAFDNEGIENAAMLFDTAAMKPLYKLSIGAPGSSFAFDIARKTGLPGFIIDNAQKKLGQQSVRFEEKLQQIEVNKLESEKHLRNVRQYDDMLFDTVNKYKNLTAELELNKTKILNDARKQAKEILDSANRRIEHAVMEIKTSSADKNTVKQIKQDIKTQIQTLVSDIENADSKLQQTQPPALKKENIKTVTTPIQTGDYVIFPQTENIGKVVSIDKNRLLIDIGEIKVKTTKSSVLKIDKASFLKQEADNRKNRSNNSGNITVKTTFDLNAVRSKFSEKLDLRGYRTQEAIQEVVSFLDTAAMLGEKHLSILHGTGNGILKTMIRNYLKTNNNVKDFHPEDVRFGGEGITVIEMK
ncbi:MAG: Smr/MutS family protein [Bacteroidales bacterium]|nr:Smr/MutS family protein [Bacteroidales bacterium]